MNLQNTPCVILCGGKGTRLGKLTKKTPKPLLKVTQFPLVYHIMINYHRYGVKNFILLTGYRHQDFEKYFKSLKESKIIKKTKNSCEFKIKLKKEISVLIFNTGLNTLKKDRILKIKKKIENDIFFLTYGDGLGLVNIKQQYKFHLKSKKIVTLLGTNPPSRFGEIKLKKNNVISLNEKPLMSQGLINGGYMVLNKKIFTFFTKIKKELEHGIINNLCKKGQVTAYINKKFWQCMDNEREYMLLKKKFRENKKIKSFFNI